LLKSRASGGLWSSDLVKWAIALDPKEADRLQLSILASEGHGGIAIACAPTPSPARPRHRLRAHALACAPTPSNATTALPSKPSSCKNSASSSESPDQIA
jgi:hypothetical protein